MRTILPLLFLISHAILVYGQSSITPFEVQLQHKEKSFTFQLPESFRNMENALSVGIQVKNIGEDTIYVNSFVNRNIWNNGVIILAPDEEAEVNIAFFGFQYDDASKIKQAFPGMRGLPNGWMWHWDKVNTKKIESLSFALIPPSKGASFQVNGIRPVGNIVEENAKVMNPNYLPFIDRFGQFIHKDWPGKIHTEQELVEERKKETKELFSFEEKKEWNQYGAWVNGPKLVVTGHFRVEKYKNKWWLVDPEGRLFWSQGLDCVRFNTGMTAIEKREHFFQELPDSSSHFHQFFSTGRKNQYAYSFSSSNLLRKYGESFKETHADRIHQRLRNWGINTIGNWSDSVIYLKKKTAYTLGIHFNWKPIGNGSVKFPDVYDLSFRTGLEKRFQDFKQTFLDPYCIGYFVDNELHGWGHLTHEVFKAGPESFAKKHLVRFLKKKYKSLDGINKQWETNFQTWESILAFKEIGQLRNYKADFKVFEEQTVRLYYKTCREVSKKVAPDKLYLGSRLDFHYYPHSAPVRMRTVEIAAEYCDIISFNRYRLNGYDFSFPKGIDKPIMIGEFHFGALDRGMFHGGLRMAQNQKNRALLYEHYIKGALANPNIVGAHWFKYQEQNVSGRFDHENYQIGFVDICDTPYSEMIESSRRIARELYSIRITEIEESN